MPEKGRLSLCLNKSFEINIEQQFFEPACR